MRRIISLLLAAALCLTLAACGGGKSAQEETGAPVSAELAVGDKISLGKIDKEKLTWTVIAKDMGTALVLCDKVLERRSFGEGGVHWKDSELRAYLNGEFIDAVFSADEAEKIAEVEHATEIFDFDSYTTLEERSSDRVFLLSTREFFLYVTPIEDLRYGVPAKSVEEHVYVADVTNSSKYEKACSWDLRDDGEQSQGTVRSINGWDGDVNGYGTGKTDSLHIRPAMWIYTDRELAAAYRAGTAQRPADETLSAYIASLHKGSEASFGRWYDRDWRNGNQEIKWRVLDEADDALLLYSDELFGVEQFSQTDDENVDWSTSYLRWYINGQHFLDLYFTPEEQSKIRVTHLTTSDGDPMWGRDGGPDTDDRLFLLDQTDILRYFPTEAERVVSESSYWLRSPDFAPGFFSLVNWQGNLTTDQATSRLGIRIALWVEK